ncbi:MAG: VWA domain-containing protein [Lentisphaeria bacterium]|nr:VWA domain-containing protein [Lentisphaeria bacterium]
MASAAAAIPVALHLLHRRKPQPVPFSTLRFLREAIASTRRSRHLTNLLTLLMRIFIILLLAFAFSQPQVTFTTLIPEGRRTCVIVLDSSASMQFRDGESTCFANAKEWAIKLIRSLGEGDRVAVLTPGVPHPRLAFPPTSDREAIIRVLNDLEAGHGHTSIPDTLTDFLKRIDKIGKTTGLELHVFSDFQKAGWDDKAMQSVGAQLAERGILLFLNHTRPPIVANAGITKAAFYPPAILGDGAFHTRATVLASSEFNGGNRLRLTVQDDQQADTSFTLLPGKSSRQVLAGAARGEDEHVMGMLQLEPDGFDLDNVFRFCLPRRTAIPVLLVDGSAEQVGEGRETFFVKHAIQPGGKTTTLFQPRQTDWPSFLSDDLHTYSVVFVCNPPSLGEAASRKITEFARRGGTVVLMPGQHHALESSLDRLPVLSGFRVDKEVLPEEKGIGIVGSEKPSQLEKRLLSIMPPPANLVVRRRLIFKDLPANAKPVFHYADGGVFAMALPLGKGSVWVTSVSANRDWSEWPLTPFFVLFTQELIKGSARHMLAERTTEVGSPVVMEWPENALELDFHVQTPDGNEHVTHISRTDIEKPVLIGGFTRPGFYTIRRGDAKHVVAVNLPEDEMEMVYQSMQELALPLRGVSVYQADSWHKHQQNLVNLRQGRPLWPLLLCIAFFLTVTEELFANIRSRASAVPEALRQFTRRGARA